MKYYSVILLVFVSLYCCGIQPVQSGCTDTKTWCSKKTVWCTGKFGPWMAKNCCKTCSKAVGCKNKKWWCNKKKNWCQGKYGPWMKENCCKTCGGRGGGSTKTGAAAAGAATFKYVPCKKVDPCVEDLNTYRRLRENTADLKCDQKLTEEAQKWADHLAQTIKKMRHSKGTGMGENLYSSSVWPKQNQDRTKTCKGANWAWYNEVKRWDDNTYDRKPVFKAKIDAAKTESEKHHLGHVYAVGHFTQLVWKATTRVGFGFVQFDKGMWRKTIVVARFLAPGNYQPLGPNGPYSKNVGKRKQQDEIFTEIVGVQDDEDDEEIPQLDQKAKDDPAGKMDNMIEEVLDIVGGAKKSSLKSKREKDEDIEKAMTIISDMMEAK